MESSILALALMWYDMKTVEEFENVIGLILPWAAVSAYPVYNCLVVLFLCGSPCYILNKSYGFTYTVCHKHM